MADDTAPAGQSDATKTAKPDGNATAPPDGGQDRVSALETKLIEIDGKYKAEIAEAQKRRDNATAMNQTIIGALNEILPDGGRVDPKDYSTEAVTAAIKALKDGGGKKQKDGAKVYTDDELEKIFSDRIGPLKESLTQTQEQLAHERDAAETFAIQTKLGDEFTKAKGNPEATAAAIMILRPFVSVTTDSLGNRTVIVNEKTAAAAIDRPPTVLDSTTNTPRTMTLQEFLQAWSQRATWAFLPSGGGGGTRGNNQSTSMENAKVENYTSLTPEQKAHVRKGIQERHSGDNLWKPSTPK